MNQKLADQCTFSVIYNITGTEKPPGGQHAGCPATSVRVTHKETGIMAQCGLERSQHKNKKIALEMIEYALVNIGIDI